MICIQTAWELGELTIQLKLSPDVMVTNTKMHNLNTIMVTFIYIHDKTIPIWDTEIVWIFPPNKLVWKECNM
jgi:hypothetical protein